MHRQTTRQQRKVRIRSKVKGTTERPRLSVFRSNVAIYAQIIDDSKNQTLVGVSEKLTEVKGKKIEKAKAVGTLLAEKAKKKKISKVIFDKGQYKYHGRVKALAEGAREGGLDF